MVVDVVLREEGVGAADGAEGAGQRARRRRVRLVVRARRDVRVQVQRGHLHCTPYTNTKKNPLILRIDYILNNI